MGEFEVIASVVSRLSGFAAQGRDVIVGPGDDAAVLAIGSEQVVFATDMAVEGVDFRREWSTWQEVGARIAAANLADCEAMGARGSALVVSLAGPIDEQMATALAEGIGTEAAKVGAVVVGGDLSQGAQVVIAVAIIGRLDGRAAVLRSGARVGDQVVLVGRTGRSAAGLALLESGRGDGAPELTAVYRVPEVPYGAGALLADAGAHAMIDVSDGLLADLEHICTASGVAMEIDPSRLEISELVAAAGELGIDPLVWALSGGEDHALIATLPEGAVLPEAAMVIGRVREGAGVTVRGIDTSSWKKGWNHFAGDAGEQTRA